MLLDHTDTENLILLFSTVCPSLSLTYQFFHLIFHFNCSIDIFVQYVHPNQRAVRHCIGRHTMLFETVKHFVCFHHIVLLVLLRDSISIDWKIDMRELRTVCLKWNELSQLCFKINKQAVITLSSVKNMLKTKSK